MRVVDFSRVLAGPHFTKNTARQFGGSGNVGEGRLRSDSLSHADVYSGLHGAIAVLAGLAHRARTGEGQYVDIAMAAVVVSINERIHVDLSGEDLGAEQPILGATDAPFFLSPEGDTFVSPMSLVGSLTFPFYLSAMRRPDLAEDSRFLTPELRRENFEALHGIVQTWIYTFADMDSLDAQFDEAKIATGRFRDITDLPESEWAVGWNATREVSDRSGGTMVVPGLPWHFSTDEPGSLPHVPALQGEHNAEILKELGLDDDAIMKLMDSQALVQPGREPLGAGQ